MISCRQSQIMTRFADCGPAAIRDLAPEDLSRQSISKKKRDGAHTCDGHRSRKKKLKPLSLFLSWDAHLRTHFATQCGLLGSQSSVLPVCNHVRTSRRNICPMHSHSSTWAGCQRHQINWEHYFRNRDPQVPQVAVHHMWALPRFFFEISCPDGSYGHGKQPNLATLGRI